MKKIAIIVLAVLLNSSLWGQTYHFDFTNSQEGWVFGFADYPIGSEAQYQLNNSWSSLPNPLNGNQKSLFITGSNQSDDLFMFVKKHITGLQANTTYTVTFEVEFASTYPTNAIGVGGAPGEGVVMKAGVTLVNPDTIHQLTDVRMGIDKANQTQPGTDMDTIGHVGVVDSTTVYALKTNNNFSHPFSITTDASGEVWLIVGTDSGFEATTALYYNQIEAIFSRVTAIEKTKKENYINVFPNPSTGEISINTPYHIEKLEVYSLEGKLMKTIKNPTSTLSLDLTAGIYFLKGYTTNHGILSEKLVLLKD